MVLHASLIERRILKNPEGGDSEIAPQKANLGLDGAGQLQARIKHSIFGQDARVHGGQTTPGVSSI